jgi:hypothetical protein
MRPLGSSALYDGSIGSQWRRTCDAEVVSRCIMYQALELCVRGAEPWSGL